MTRAKDISKIVTDANLSGTLDVAGAVTVGSGSNTTISIDSSSAFDASLTTDGANQALNIIGTNNSSNGNVYIKTGGTGTPLTRARFNPNGDISFYEDTGTTPKLFWDASAESLGIGNTSGNSKLIVQSGDAPPTTSVIVSGKGSVRLSSTQTRGDGIGPSLVFEGRVSTGGSQGDLAYIQGANDSSVNGNRSGRLVFAVANGSTQNITEAMRIDSSGNLLVGTTDTTPFNNNAGTSADFGFVVNKGGGYTSLASYNTTPLYINRTSSDGDIVSFRKNGTTVGSIASVSGGMSFFATGVNNCGWYLTNNSAMLPMKNSALSDNLVDLGSTSYRFDDIFATNGTIITSDQNEKNTITDSDLGIDFIKRLTPKSYIFNGKTRTHYGLIAQDVETVLSDISKPTSGFAGFIKTDISEEQDGSEYRYGLRYTEFVAPLIQAVKDQQATIDALTARITALENGE
jgi:hypothetical protein